MKKTMVRIVAALLVAMLALTLLPMGAFAIDAVIVERGYYDVKNPSMDNYNDWTYYDEQGYGPGEVIQVKDYNNPLILLDANGNKVLYDFAGFENNVVVNKFFENLSSMTPEQQQAALKNTGVPFFKNNITVPNAENPGMGGEVLSSMTEDEAAEWYATWSYIYASYVPHSHALSRWYSDGTTHWKECLTCKKYLHHFNQFMYQNWCQDGDEDGICNICGGDVPYHDVTVIEEEGGKIIVNRDNACHRMKITADVEPAEGYKLKKLHFTKVRDDGSEQEITRYKKDGQFWTYMPTYDLEVSAEFVKVKTKK